MQLDRLFGVYAVLHQLVRQSLGLALVDLHARYHRLALVPRGHFVLESVLAELPLRGSRRVFLLLHLCGLDDPNLVAFLAIKRCHRVVVCVWRSCEVEDVNWDVGERYVRIVLGSVLLVGFGGLEWLLQDLLRLLLSRYLLLALVVLDEPVHLEVDQLLVHVQQLKSCTCVDDRQLLDLVEVFLDRQRVVQFFLLEVVQRFFFLGAVEVHVASLIWSYALRRWTLQTLRVQLDVRVNLISQLQLEVAVALVVDGWELLADFELLVLGLVADHRDVIVLEALKRRFSVVG